LNNDYSDNKLMSVIFTPCLYYACLEVEIYEL
jgi:hypothetical protein